MPGIDTVSAQTHRWRFKVSATTKLGNNDITSLLREVCLLNAARMKYLHPLIMPQVELTVIRGTSPVIHKSTFYDV